MLSGYSLAPNGSRVETPASITQRTSALVPAAATLNRELVREIAAAGYATPISGGSSPAGLGYTFGDSWSRTQRGVMEFSMPVGQVANINMSLRYAAENLFMAKGLKLRTMFTCTGLQNQSSDDTANGFFDSVTDTLGLHQLYRWASWMYDAAGIVPIIMTPPGKPLTYLQIMDPRMVHTQTDFGKTKMWLIPDQRMKDAYANRNSTTNLGSKAYWDAMPSHWRSQIAAMSLAGRQQLIELKDGEYIVLQNRMPCIDRQFGSWDGAPLQPYFAALDEYRMHMAGDYATAFVAKNLIALVSVGDPKAEGDNYLRPDDTVLTGLAAAIGGNPNKAQYTYGDPTISVRYITPGPDAYNSPKYDNCKEILKNFLPSPFWYNAGQGAFAAATVEMQALQEEIKFKNSDFDLNFWTPIYRRSAEGRSRIANKAIKAPKHDHTAMMDKMALATQARNLYGDGGLDIRSLIEANGHDPDVIKQRLQDQQKDVKGGLYMPAFEQKQNIVAEKTYGVGVDPPMGKAGAKANGRPAKPGSRPQSESKQGRRTPRPGAKTK